MPMASSEASCPRIANQQDGEKFGTFDSGYLTWVHTFSQINTYFKRPLYDVATTDFLQSAKQPFGIAEFLTFALGGDNGTFDASGFTGPALVSPFLSLSTWLCTFRCIYRECTC